MTSGDSVKAVLCSQSHDLLDEGGPHAVRVVARTDVPATRSLSAARPRLDQAMSFGTDCAHAASSQCNPNNSSRGIGSGSYPYVRPVDRHVFYLDVSLPRKQIGSVH